MMRKTLRQLASSALSATTPAADDTHYSTELVVRDTPLGVSTQEANHENA
jgi:hypothetical protein